MANVLGRLFLSITHDVAQSDGFALLNIEIRGTVTGQASGHQDQNIPHVAYETDGAKSVVHHHVFKLLENMKMIKKD